MLSTCMNVPEAAMGPVLLETMKSGKSPELLEMVERFGELMVLEYRHFMKLHGLGKGSAPLTLPK